MRKTLVTLVTVVLLVVASLALAPASPAQGDPCAEGPGHSPYAQEHIVQLAQAGALGKEHIPGEHRGYAGLC